MDEPNKPEAETTAPPAATAEGVALHGDYPLNHRLRAEALAADGKEEDPDGLIAPELIAETRDRVAAEKADQEAAELAAERAAPSTKWTRDKLVEAAGKANVAVTADMDKAAIVAAIEAAPPVESKGA